MSTTTKPNLKRTKPLKVPLNDVERDLVQKFCPGQIAPYVRNLLLAHVRGEANRTVEKPRAVRQRHGHQHGHAQRFPGRAAVAGGFRRLHL